MHILFILTELPFPASRNGIALINHHLLTNAPLGTRIDLFITGIEEGSAIAELRAVAPTIDKIEFSGEALSRKYRVGNLLTGALTGRNAFTQPALRRYFQAHRGHYAAIYVSPLMAGLDFKLAAPLFLNAVDSFARLNENAYIRSGRIRDLLKMWLYRIYERRTLHAAALINFVSSSDLESVRGHSQALPLINISNGVDSSVFRPDESRRIPGRVLFTGNFDYAPNAQAARHLALDIFPRIRSMSPEATLQIVGRNPPPELLGLPGVIATGFVDDIAACYQSAEVFVCPLQSGAGVKNKILEALSTGLPIVTSSLGVDGIEHIQEGEHYLLANDPETFAHNTVRMLADSPMRRAMGQSSRAVAVRHLSWQPVVDRYFDALAQLARARVELVQ